MFKRKEKDYINTSKKMLLKNKLSEVMIQRAFISTIFTFAKNVHMIHHYDMYNTSYNIYLHILWSSKKTV